MHCPKCQFDHPLQTTECLKCGIVFSRYQPPLDPIAIPTVPAVPPFLAFQSSPVDRSAAERELKYRALALPLALLLARLLCGTNLRIAASMLAMVLHESGHAITAWLTGRWAVPLLWVTQHGEERSWSIVLILSAAILFVGFHSWKARRWGWLSAAAVLFLLQIIALSLPAGALIVFFGDGGALFFGTILMASFYAPRESALRKNQGLRWGFLAIGALSFMHVFMVWSGPLEDIPFGEIEGVNLSDPSLLTEMYGWSLTQLVDRYLRLATLCLVFLLALYVWGLFSAYLELRRSPSPEN
jgi:hypothetical protein